jgi:hypothetical protein
VADELVALAADEVRIHLVGVFRPHSGTIEPLIGPLSPSVVFHQP